MTIVPQLLASPEAFFVFKLHLTGEGFIQSVDKTLGCGVQRGVLHQLADADLIGGALGGGIVRAGGGMSQPVEGVSVLSRRRRQGTASWPQPEQERSNFFFIVIFSFCPYPDEFIKLDAFQKTRGALSVEQSPLAFNG